MTTHDIDITKHRIIDGSIGVTGGGLGCESEHAADRLDCGANETLRQSLAEPSHGRFARSIERKCVRMNRNSKFEIRNKHSPSTIDVLYPFTPPSIAPSIGFTTMPVMPSNTLQIVVIKINIIATKNASLFSNYPRAKSIEPSI
jgi:hypothetical protein